MNTIPVFYCENMVGDVASFSPGSGKPKPVVESWLNLEMPISIRDVVPVIDDMLCLAHSPNYVKKIFSGQEINGFRNTKTELAETCRYTVGAMLAAGREAISNGKLAVAPVAGFHHARYAKAGGFCTFNGLIIAAIALKNEGLVQRVGIIDCDVHMAMELRPSLNYWN